MGQYKCNRQTNQPTKTSNKEVQSTEWREGKCIAFSSYFLRSKQTSQDMTTETDSEQKKVGENWMSMLHVTCEIHLHLTNNSSGVSSLKEQFHGQRICNPERNVFLQTEWEGRSGQRERSRETWGLRQRKKGEWQRLAGEKDRRNQSVIERGEAER